jgi:hypothetical protein
LFELTCGSWTSRENQLTVDVWRPKPGLFLCMRWGHDCGWIKAKPKPPPTVYPEDPRELF